MRKAVLFIAMSLDGYIADRDGNVNWLGGEDRIDQYYINVIPTILGDGIGGHHHES